MLEESKHKLRFEIEYDEFVLRENQELQIEDRGLNINFFQGRNLFAGFMRKVYFTIRGKVGDNTNKGLWAKAG